METIQRKGRIRMADAVSLERVKPSDKKDFTFVIKEKGRDWVLDPGSEAEAVLGRAHRAATGEDLQSFVTPGYLDCRVYQLYNRIPSLCYGPKSENIHGVDERVSVDSIRRTTIAMALFIAEWCGVEAVGA